MKFKNERKFVVDRWYDGERREVSLSEKEFSVVVYEQEDRTVLFDVKTDDPWFERYNVVRSVKEKSGRKVTRPLVVTGPEEMKTAMEICCMAPYSKGAVVKAYDGEGFPSVVERVKKEVVLDDA